MARRRKNPLVLAPAAISWAGLAGMNPPMTPEQAMAWLEKVGSWPSSDPEVQRKTAEAERVLWASHHRGNPQDYSLCIMCDKKLDDQARRHGSRVCKRCTPRGYVPEGARHGGFDRPDRDDLGRYEHGRRGNPVYPVRTPTTQYPFPPAGFVDAPDIFAADRMAKAKFGPSATFGVGYANMDRARAREVTCGCRHGTSPEGYPFLDRCPMHLAQANAGRKRNPKRSKRRNPHQTEADKVARKNKWTSAYALGWLDGKRDKSARIAAAIPQQETTDYAHGYWRGYSERANPLEITTSGRAVVHRVASAKSRKAKCGETDGSASVHASQVTCPDCRAKKRSKRKRNPKRRKNSPPARYDRDLLMADVDGLADSVRYGDTLDEAYLKTLAPVMRDAGITRRDLAPGDLDHWERALWDQILNASNSQLAAYVKHRERVINA